MNFIAEYFEVIDIIALLALVALAVAAYARRGGLWVAIMCIVVVIWAAVRIFNIL